MDRLAQWIMGGRGNALFAAAALGVLPLLGWASVAVVALVALRRGLADALWPLAGALSAALFVFGQAGDVSQLGTLIAALAGALVLANSRSLALALVALSLVVGLYLVLVMQWAPERFDPLENAFRMALEQLRQSGEPDQGEAADRLAQIDLRQWVMEGMGLMIAVAAILALLVARWMQARLYNPGGFRSEFHHLRVPLPATVALALGMTLTRWHPPAVILLPMLVLPLALAGLGLVHGLFARRTGRATPLIFFYLALVLLAGPGFMVLIAAAITDSFVDFRKRMGTARP